MRGAPGLDSGDRERKLKGWVGQDKEVICIEEILNLEITEALHKTGSVDIEERRTGCEALRHSIGGVAHGWSEADWYVLVYELEKLQFLWRKDVLIRNSLV
jgi:hypothetical protein